jgi:hypothetical protein
VGFGRLGERAFALSGHRTPLVSLKAVLTIVPVFRGLDGEPECDFARVIETLKQMVASEIAKLAPLAWSRL